MTKTVLGFLFVVFGIAYGSLLFDFVYENTLGFLVKNKWITPPSTSELGDNILGRKPTILIYSLILIIIGIYLLWNRNL